MHSNQLNIKPKHKHFVASNTIHVSMGENIFNSIRKIQKWAINGVNLGIKPMTITSAIHPFASRWSFHFHLLVTAAMRFENPHMLVGESRWMAEILFLRIVMCFANCIAPGSFTQTFSKFLGLHWRAICYSLKSFAMRERNRDKSQEHYYAWL